MLHTIDAILAKSFSFLPWILNGFSKQNSQRDKWSYGDRKNKNPNVVEEKTEELILFSTIFAQSFSWPKFSFLFKSLRLPFFLNWSSFFFWYFLCRMLYCSFHCIAINNTSNCNQLVHFNKNKMWWCHSPSQWLICAKVKTHLLVCHRLCLLSCKQRGGCSRVLLHFL